MPIALRTLAAFVVGLIVSVTCPTWNSWVARLFGQRDGDGPALQGIPFGFLMLLPVSATVFFAMSVRNRFTQIGLYVSLTLAVLIIGANIAGLAYQSTSGPTPPFHVNVNEGMGLVEQLRKERPEVEIGSTQEPGRLVITLRRPSQIGKCVITADGLMTCVIEADGTTRYSEIKQIPDLAAAKRSSIKCWNACSRGADPLILMGQCPSLGSAETGLNCGRLNNGMGSKTATTSNH